MLQTNQTNENKTTSVVEIDLKKNEHKKLSLIGQKGKVALGIILIIWVTLGLLFGCLLGFTNDMTYVGLSFLVATFIWVIAASTKMSKYRKDYKKRYILKSETLGDIVNHLDCPNYEQKVREIKVVEEEEEESNDDDYYDDVEDYYSMIEEPEENSSYVHSFDEIDLEKKVLEIVEFAKAKGLNTNPLSVRRFLSAINSSHLIEVSSSSVQLSKKFVDVISEFMGRKAFYAKENPSWKEPKDTLWRKRDDQVVESEILKSVLFANKNKNTFTFLGLVDVNYPNFEEYFSQMLHFVNFPNLRLLLEVSAKFDNGIDPAGKTAIPRNLWFVIFPKNDTEKMSEKTCKNIVSIEIDGTIIQENENVKTPENVIIEQYNYSINKKCDEFEINEDLWKKYDEFINKVNEIVDLKLNDKYFYGIENYALMMVCIGAEQSTAIDNVINSKILPLLLNMKKLSVEEIDSLIRLVETIFDTEGFTATLKTLNKLKEN